MKKVLLVILAIYCSISVSAQKIHFTDTSNQWKELHVSATGTAGAPEFYYSSYYFTGDTTLDSFKYRNFHFWAGVVREDTILKKVYYRDVYSGDTDVVLMDYNLVVGDTFNINAAISYSCQYLVTGIDSTLINSKWYKVWHFSRKVGSGLIAWADIIEGIGCIQDPSYMAFGMPSDGAWDYMYCFSNQGITSPLSPPISFLDNTTSCSYYSTVFTPQLQQNNHKITLYPNPATSTLNIQSTDAIKEVIITNLLGQTIYSKPPTANCKLQTIDVATWPPGIYFVKVNGVVQKFVKS